jgi:hypothetical protein
VGRQRDWRMYRVGTAAALVAAPAIFLVDNLLHPTEYTRGHEAEQLEAIAGAVDRWQLAHVLGLVSALLFVPVVLGLAYLVRGRAPRLGLYAGALALLGLLGLSAALAIDGFAWGVLGEVAAVEGSDRATLELALARMQESGWSIAYYAPLLLWVAGLVALAAGAARARAVPLGGALVFAVGVLMVGVEGAVQDNAWFIAAAAVLLVGAAWMAGAVARMDDADFAGDRIAG